MLQLVAIADEHNRRQRIEGEELQVLRFVPGQESCDSLRVFFDRAGGMIVILER
jgi:hypothetical protein